MKKYIFALLFAAGLSALAGCNEERPGYWQAGGRVRFYTSATALPTDNYTATTPTKIWANGDTLTMSNGAYNTSIPTLGPAQFPGQPQYLEATVYYRIQVMGEKSAAERRIKVEQYADEQAQGSNLVPVRGVNFEWDDDFVVPAGEFVVDFPITIKFDEASATGSFKNYLLLFRLVDSEDFKAVETHRTARMSFMQNR